MRTLIHLMLLFSLLISMTLAYSADDKKKSPQQKNATPAIRYGEAHTLKANSKPFLSIYMPSNQAHTKGAIILIPDSLGHANTNTLIKPMRIEFPKHGWATLSISIADNKDIDARIKAALQFLEKKDIKPIYLLAYSKSGLLTLMSARDNKKVSGIILISVFSNDKKTVALINKNLPEMKTPVIDIVAAHDFSTVTKQARKRHNTNRTKKNTNYRYVKIIGTDHYYGQMTPYLNKKIRGWIASHPVKHPKFN